MGRKFNPKAVRYLFFSLLFAFIIFIVAIDKLGVTNLWLKTNAPLKADILIMERWIPPIFYYDILNEYKNKPYKKIVITGAKAQNTVTLFEQGALVIKNLSDYSTESSNKITIDLTGYWAKQAFSICKLTLGDSILYNKEVFKDQRLYFNLPISKNDSLVIAFTNDAYEGRFDRNLAINRIKVNGEIINLFSEKNYVISGKSNQVNYFNNMRDLAVYRLIRNGIPREEIISLKAKKGGLSRTYNNAIVAAEWMSNNNYNSANIITLSYHSKRTYHSFLKASSDIKFGIESINASTSKYRTIKEIIGNLFIKVTPRFILNLPKEKRTEDS